MGYYRVMKFGRPSKYKRKYNLLAFDLLTKGYSKEAVAGKIGISKQCFYEWVQKYQDFGDAVQRGESASQFYWEDLGMLGTLGQIKGFNASSWMFNMKNRFGWSEKVDSNDRPQQITFQEVSFIDYMEYYKKHPQEYRGATTSPHN